MSKLYDALLRDKGSIEGLDPAALIGDLQSPVESSVVPAPLAAEPVPVPELVSSDPELVAVPVSVAVAPVVPEAPTSVAPPAPAPVSAPAGAENLGRGSSGYRRLCLRLPQRSPALPFSDDHWLANEQYRILRTKILQHIKQPKVILVSSAGAGDGKSITAINLAGVLSLRSEARVLLVDGDFRKSAMHVQLGISESPGLADVLEGRNELTDAIVETEEFPNLYLLPAGNPMDNPAELLQSSRWLSIAALLRRQFRYIIIDSPPIAAVADYDLLQSVADGVIIVVRPDHTSRSACKHALSSVPKDKLLGVLLNCVTAFFLGKGYGYGYSTPYYYTAEK